MLVILAGIFSDVRPLSEKVFVAMLVTLSGMFIDVRLLHFSKAYPPMFVTLAGMFIEVRLLHPEYIDIADYQLFVVNTVEK